MTYRWLSPEEEQLLGGGHLVAASCGLEHDEGDTDNGCLFRLDVAVTPLVIAGEARDAEHVDEVLFGDVVLLVDVALEGGKDLALLQEVGATLSLDVDLGGVGMDGPGGGGVVLGKEAGFGGDDGKVVELLAEDDNGLLVEQRVLGAKVVLAVVIVAVVEVSVGIGQSLGLSSHLGFMIEVEDIVHAGGVKVDKDYLVVEGDGFLRVVVVVIVVGVGVASAKDEAVGKHDYEDGFGEGDENLAVDLEAGAAEVEEEL